MKIYLSTQIIINDGQDISLNKKNKLERLLAYFYLKKESDIKKYVLTGLKQ